MADKVAVALIRDRALDRLTHATEQISAALSVDAPDMPEFYRDRDYLQARQLDALASWAEGVANELAQTTPVALERSTSNAAIAKNKRSGS